MIEGITIATIICGMFLVFISFALKTEEQSYNSLDQDQYEEYGARIKELNQKILEVNEFSQFIQEEMNKKQKELLFLYQLIHEKSNEIKGTVEAKNYDFTIEKNPKPISDEIVDKLEKDNQSVLQLAKKGYSIKEIAKILDIGQGEVNLILNLYH